MRGPDVAVLQRPFIEAPSSAAVLTDFDGTLSGMVEDPRTARPWPGALAALTRLVERFGVVGVVSGRPVAFLTEQLGTVTGLHLVGLYGLERAVGDRVVTHPDALAWVDALAAAATEAEAVAPAGILVERKGLAVTLHVRTVPSLAPWIEQFAVQQTARRGLHAHPGRLAVELRPPVAVDKGTMVAELAAGCTAVCYCGDDVGDLPAFAALDRLRRQGIATLAVAASSAESPPELASAVDVVVDGPGGMVAFLSGLAELR